MRLNVQRREHEEESEENSHTSFHERLQTAMLRATWRSVKP
jgi:hypothetical protein